MKMVGYENVDGDGEGLESRTDASQNAGYIGRRGRDERISRIEELSQDVLTPDHNGSVDDAKSGVQEYRETVRQVGKNGNRFMDFVRDLGYRVGAITPEGEVRKDEKRLEVLASKYEGNIRAMKRDRKKVRQDLQSLEGTYDGASELRVLLQDEIRETGAELMQLNSVYLSALHGGNPAEDERTAADIREEFYAKREQFETSNEQVASTEFEIKRLRGQIGAKKETVDYLSTLITTAQGSKMRIVDQERTVTVDDVGNSTYPITIAEQNEEAEAVVGKHQGDMEKIREGRGRLYDVLGGILTAVNGKGNGKSRGNGELKKLVDEAGKYMDRLHDEVDEIQERRKQESLL